MPRFKPEDIFIEATSETPAVTAGEAMLRPCRTREELRSWLWHFLDLDPPDRIVDPDSTCTPLDMAWKIYSNCLWWHELPDAQRERKMLFYANRDGFKTLIAAAVEFMIVLHDKRGVVHTAATALQAGKAYEEYFKTFLKKPLFQPLLKTLTKDTQKQVTFADGTNIICIPVTKQAVQGQHEPLLCRDEIDVVGDMSVYQDLDGIPVSTRDGSKRPPIDFGISVRKSAFGLVQREVEAFESGRKEGNVYHWNLIDCTERCPDSRSGTTPTTLYILDNSMHYVNAEEYAKLDDGEKQKYSAHPALEGCYDNCDIFAACMLNLKNQTSTCTWLKPIDEVRHIMKKSEDSMFIASFLSRKPPSEGLVFTRFDDKNKKSYAEMYEIFTGEKWPHERMRLDELVAVFRQNGANCIAGVDWGFNDPAVCVVMYVDGSENVYVVYSMVRTGMDDSDFVDLIKSSIHDRFGVEMYYPDSANPGAIKRMNDADLPVSRRVDKTPGSVYDGVQEMKRFVTAPGTNKAKLFVARNPGDTYCDFVINEFGKYHHKMDLASGRPDDTQFADEFDHSMDAIRYALHTRYGKKRARATVVTEKDAPPGTIKRNFDPVSGAFVNPPSPVELAQTMGIRGFNDNRADFEEKNNVRTRKVKKQDDGGRSGGDGGFSWSF